MIDAWLYPAPLPPALVDALAQHDALVVSDHDTLDSPDWGVAE